MCLETWAFKTQRKFNFHLAKPTSTGKENESLIEVCSGS